MGKKRRIRSGAGDFVPLPGALHRQIEGGRIAKKSRRDASRGNELDGSSDEEAKRGNEMVGADLSSKILKVARIQIDDDEGQVADIEERDEQYPAVGEKGEQVKQRRVRFKGAATVDHSQSESAAIIPVNTNGLTPEVVELYREVGVVLSQFSSGKIPKAFKVIPNLVNWEQLLELTTPDNWTAAAMYQATRLFSSCMSPSMCQKFYNLILLPRIRDDIHEFKRLNPHLYECLFKAIFKPGAFFKGILLPLCESGDCTLREANIIGNVLKKISIPILHASAAMLKISQMDYSPARSIFLRFLIAKRYTLPVRLLEGIVDHFLRADGQQGSDSVAPVLWHRCLMAFAENYSSDMSAEQREALLEIIKVRSHPMITPVIRQHLQLVKPLKKNGKDKTNEQAELIDDMEF